MYNKVNYNMFMVIFPINIIIYKLKNKNIYLIVE
jgi:hypothetical protein